MDIKEVLKDFVIPPPQPVEVQIKNTILGLNGILITFSIITAMTIIAALMKDKSMDMTSYTLAVSSIFCDFNNLDRNLLLIKFILFIYVFLFIAGTFITVSSTSKLFPTLIRDEFKFDEHSLKLLKRISIGLFILGLTYLANNALIRELFIELSPTFYNKYLTGRHGNFGNDPILFSLILINFGVLVINLLERVIERGIVLELESEGTI